LSISSSEEITVIRKVKTFLQSSLRRKCLFFVAVLLSLYAWFLMRFFRKQAHFGKAKIVCNKKIVDHSVVRDVRWAIFTANKYVFWENVCRHQAYQAMLLFRYFRYPYEIFVGFKKNPENGVIEGHAWTNVNGEFVTGFCNPDEYVVQAVYP
jgi:hypothetical protein